MRRIVARATDFAAVTQSRVGNDGTCFRACIASILDLKESQVTDFDKEPDYWEAVDDFLASHGLTYRRVPIDATRPSGYSTIEGISPRGGLHACVALDGKLVHDPHPQDGTGRGLVEPRYYGLFEKRARAKDAGGYECKGGCGRMVERRYKNSVCQYCLSERHEAQRKLLRPLEAEVKAARGDLERYQAAVKALKAAKSK